MKLEQQLLIHREWSQNNKYWLTENEVRTTPIDQQGMKLAQQLLINRWMKLEQHLLTNRELN